MAGKAKKIIGGVLIFVVLLVVLLLCTFLFWLGPTVKMVAEHVGSKALGTPLTISELKINPRDGTFHMSGFVIANHSEFGRTNTVGLASMDIALDVSSIFSSTVVVHRVQIESPHFVYEQNEATDNISEYIRNIEAYLGIDPDHPAKPRPVEIEEDDVPSEPKFVIVEELEINDTLFYLVNTEEPLLDIEVGLEQLSVSMTNGTVSLKNFHISNPQRLETPNLFTLDSIDIEVDPATIYSDTVSIRDVQVTRPYAYLEQNPETDTVAEFMHIAEGLAKATTARPKEQENDEQEIPEPVTAAAAPLELHHLVVDDIQLKYLGTTQADALGEPRMLAGIDSISIELVDGRIRISSITIPNAAGYHSTNLFHLAAIDISIDPESIFSDQLSIREIRIDSPEINLEQTETSGNVADLQNDMMGFVPPERAVEEAPTPEAAPPSEVRPEPIPLAEQPVLLHALVVTNFAVNLKLPAVTNEASWSIGETDLNKLNPLKKLSLDKLNPMDKLKLDKLNILDGSEEEEPEADPDAPITILAFQSLSIQPLKGMIDIKNLRVANPPGFTRRKLARLGSLHCELNPDSLQRDPLEIKEIVISEPRVRYERQIRVDNVKALQQEIEQATTRRQKLIKKDEEAPPAQEPEAPSVEKDGQKVVVGTVLITGSSVQAKLSALPATPPIPLPKIELHDIGKDKGGATLGEAATQVFDTFYETMINAIGQTTGFATDALKGIGALTLETIGLKEKNDKSAETASQAEAATDPDIESGEEPKSRPKRGSIFLRHGRRF